MQSRQIGVVLSLCAALFASPSFAIPAAVQDFEDGTTQGWTAGGGPSGGVPLDPPAVVSGGAGGADDDYLRITSTGLSGPGGNLTALNSSAWSGNYTEAGLTRIDMDLRNFAAVDLYVRVLLLDLSDLSQVGYAITDAVFLPSGGGWTAASFLLAAADLTALVGPVDALLQSVTQIRILGSGDPAWLFEPGEQRPLTAVLGADNIAPNVFGDGGDGNGDHGVPEPSTIWLASAGLLAAACRVGTSRRRPA